MHIFSMKELGALAWFAILITIILPSTASPLNPFHSLTTATTIVSEHREPWRPANAGLDSVLNEWAGFITKRHSLCRRSGLKLIHAEHTSAIVPTSLAVPGLQLFYHTLIACVQTRWRTSPPLPEISLGIGNLHLRMSSATPIAWDFVVRFGMKMLNTATLGFAGTYEILYADEEIGHMVSITLEIIGSRNRPESQSILHKAIRAVDVPASSATAKTPLRDDQIFMGLDLSSINLRYFHISFAVAPTPIACLSIGYFYNQIIQRMSTTQDILPNLFTISKGPLALTVSSVDAPITRDLLDIFCTSMANFASRGWLPFYELRYIDPATDGVVSITLYLRGPGIPLSLWALGMPIVPTKTGQAKDSSQDPWDTMLVRQFTTRAANSEVPHRLFRSLHKRGPSMISPKLKLQKIYGTLLPIPMAVQGLISFYEIVKTRVTDDQWFPEPSSSLFTITEGAFQLTVSSLGGPVPTQLLFHYAKKMIDNASKGWLPVADVYYADDAIGLTVAIGLHIMGVSETLRRPSKRSYAHVSAKRLAAIPTSRLTVKRSNPVSFSPIKFHHLSMITPVNVAARYLEDFYDLIALKIETGFWTAQGPLHYVTFERWNIQLSFFSYAEAVPWDFIQNFVIEMSEYAAMGFTSLYDANFEAKKTTGSVFVSVTLRLMGMLPNGDGDGGGSPADNTGKGW